jgi:L-aminopeptidase/D-esterase-like protein
MIVVATNAPLSVHNLQRLSKRAIMGLARTGSFASNGSGDYVTAVRGNCGGNRGSNLQCHPQGNIRFQCPRLA